MFHSYFTVDLTKFDIYWELTVMLQEIVHRNCNANHKHRKQATKKNEEIDAYKYV